MLDYVRNSNLGDIIINGEKNVLQKDGLDFFMNLHCCSMDLRVSIVDVLSKTKRRDRKWNQRFLSSIKYDDEDSLVRTYN